MYNEQALIAAFVKRSKRDRYRQIVSDPKHRWKWTTKLGHFSDFELRYRLPMEGRQLNRDRIARELLKRHSPTMVYAISEDPSLDGKEIPLHEALETIVGSGMGTILSCIPGRLAYVETEDERYILERNDPLERREYIRFVVGRKDEDSHVEQGVFQACYLAMEWREITGKDAAELSTLLRGSTATFTSRTHWGATNCVLALPGSRLMRKNISLAYGRWCGFSNATGSM